MVGLAGVEPATHGLGNRCSIHLSYRPAILFIPDSIGVCTQTHGKTRRHMAENSIVAKLRDALSGAVDSECQVVYILAESRKLLETCPPDPFPFALKLYCHWALHVDLEYPGTTLPFLERVETFAASVLEGNSDMLREHRMLREFVFLDTFRQQFGQFLQAFNLPTAVCDEDSRWNEFLTHYAGVIEDGSLSCKAKANSLKLVSEVVFTKGRIRAASENTYIPFGLAWTIILLDGRKLTVEVNASAPNGDEMIGSAMTLS
jgi:hypothetical protein